MTYNYTEDIDSDRPNLHKCSSCKFFFIIEDISYMDDEKVCKGCYDDIIDESENKADGRFRG